MNSQKIEYNRLGEESFTKCVTNMQIIFHQPIGPEPL